MANVTVTKHLFSFFPKLEGTRLVVEASTVSEVIAAIDALAPGFAFYVCDERGRLRRHVNVFIEELPVADRVRLSDPVTPDANVFIMQALSGG
jgi:sulfur-carrier protein